MFAPPPLHFSKAEIERLKAEALARLQEKRQSAESAASDGKTSKTPSPTPSPKASRRTGLFTRNCKIKVSSPIAQDARRSLDGERVYEGEGIARERGMTKQTDHSLPPSVPFRDQPRKAPLPPTRPPRPPGDLLLPIRSAPWPSTPVAAPRHSPPPIPDKSPRRKSSGARQPQQSQAESPRSVLADAAMNTDLAQLKIGEDAVISRAGAAVRRSPSLPTDRNATATSTKRRSINGDIAKESPSSVDMKRLSKVQSGKIDKASKKRASAAATLEATLLELNYPGLKQARRATEPAVSPLDANAAEAEQTPWKRRRKGETMSMLLDAGFSPDGDSSPTVQQSPDISSHARLHPRPNLTDKELPVTPTSITSTPTEMYHTMPSRTLPPVPRARKSRKQKRSPLAQIPETSAKSNSGNIEVLPGRLSAVPELSSISENTPPPSGASTPQATMIHLRGGSIVTVTPPELTAWQKHIYIQGPIKLPTPAILPRKNSVASLEPFQEAIDRVYQHALAVPRRRSDDMVVDDICDWIQEFGFEDTAYPADTLLLDDFTIDEVRELEETDSHETERFSTPPLEPIASPLERSVAKEVAAMSKPEPMPPVENEETLRARGIARLSRNSTSSSRKESLTLARQESIVTFAPVPENDVLTTPGRVPGAEQRDRTRKPRVDQGGFDWDDDEEIDEQPAWVAPVIARKKHGLSTRETRNPVVKMRRFMATASAIL